MKLKIFTFPEETTSFLVPSWTDLQLLSFQLAQKIHQQCPKLDRLVTLAKGGWPLSRSLVDYLNINKIASIGIKFYTNIGQKLKTPFIYQNLPVTVYKETVLLFDDVADSGYSLSFAAKYLKDNGVEKIFKATLFYKPSSKVKPDFYAYKTTAWIIFPYEARESIVSLSNRWQKKGLLSTEIKDRLNQLGFTKEEIEWSLKNK